MGEHVALDLRNTYAEDPYNVSVPDFLLEEAAAHGIGCNASNASTALVCSYVQMRLKYLDYWLYMEQLEAMNITALKAITTLTYALGVLANMLLVCYIVKFKRYKSPTFALIFSLGLCDMGTCFGGCILTTLALPILQGPVWSCALLMAIPTAFYGCSVCHMVIFSVLRFYQLVFPLEALARVTVSFIVKICAVMWPILVSFSFIVVVVDPYIKSASFPYKGQSISVCEFDIEMAQRHLLIENTYLLVPNILIATFHIIKHILVRQQGKKSVSESKETKSSRQTTDARAVTLVILAFCISSMPQFVHTYIHDVFLLEKLSYHQTIEAISLNMVFMNSALNPFIYVFCAGSVRRDVFTMISRNKRVRKAA